MIALLTWPTFGTWLPGRARGWIDPGCIQVDDALPEPDATLSAPRRRSLKWPVITLSPSQRRLVLSDLPRIATLRDFQVLAAVVLTDHVHVLLAAEQHRLVPRLVQLLKGSLSRTLSEVAGDRPAETIDAAPLLHNKWWAGQYSFRQLVDDQIADSIQHAMELHAKSAGGAYAAWPR